METGVEHCPECGAERLVDDQTHCHECGADLTRYEALTHADTESEGTAESREGDLEDAESETVDAEEESTESAEQEEGSAEQDIHSREPVVYNLDDLTGHEFEEAIAKVFERLGYRTELPGKSADRGRDVIARRGDETLIIECKHQKGSVGRPVVQKLEGATNSYAGAEHGLVITTGAFARTAEEYAQKVTTQTDLDLELWDYDRLVKEARRAEVYFTLGREDTQYVFRPELRPDDHVEHILWDQHLGGIQSEPRQTADCIDSTSPSVEYTPAVLVEYDLDRKFETQTYQLYHARDHGRAVVILSDRDLTGEEEGHWQTAEYRVGCEDQVDGQPVEAYFGLPLSNVKQEIAQRVARAHTTTVSYTGKNNQTYTEHCRVDPSDVSLEAKQVMLVHHRMGIEVGPQAYDVEVTADRDHEWLVTDTQGFHDGDSGFRLGNGYLCNDCGLISPKSGDTAGSACEDCGRTLCASHHWTWPRKAPWPARELCSECYHSKDHDSHHLSTEETFLDSRWKAGALGLLPGAPFLMGGRWLAGLAHLPIWPFYVAALGFMADTGNVAGGVFWIAVFALVSVMTSLYWSRRVRQHRSNQEELDGYEPEWQPDVR